VRVHAPGGRRWVAGHALWVSDVFAFRGSPAAWKEGLMHVTSGATREPDADERKRLHRIGDEPVVVRFTLADGATVDVAARGDDEAKLLGPFAVAEPPHNGATAPAGARSHP